MEYQNVIYQAYELGEKLEDNINDILIQEQYCAKMEILTIYFRQCREEAELMKNNFYEINEKLFSQSIKILDLAIDNANVELAKIALNNIKAMKDTYPVFFKSFYNKLLL